MLCSVSYFSGLCSGLICADRSNQQITYCALVKLNVCQQFETFANSSQKKSTRLETIFSDVEKKIQNLKSKNVNTKVSFNCKKK